MDRLRRTFDDMTPAQRGVLAVLSLLVLMTAVVAVIAALGAGSDNPTAGETTATPSSTSTVTPGSATTSTTTTTVVSDSTAVTSTSPTTTLPPERQLLLRPDGIADLYFGDPVEAVLGALRSVLGEEDEDTGWIDTKGQYRTCIGSEVRFVRWRSLQVFFTDGPSDWAPDGVRHMASYTHGDFFTDDLLDLVTADGVRIGTPVGDLRATYGDGAVMDDPANGPLFVYDPAGAAFQWGFLSGLDPADRLLSISAGFACSE